jgi:two-component system LytT family response regulator
MSHNRLRVLLADDEPLALELMRRYAISDDSVDIVAEAVNGDALAAALRETKPDVLFVDIRMPGTDVFEVLAQRGAESAPLPAVIFATAFDAYAVRAFEMNAVDYLIKPFTAARFSQAILRARSHTAGSADDRVGRAIRDLGPRPDRVLVPEGRRMVPIATKDIEWIEAEGDYARVHAGGKSYLLSRSMKELSSRLDPDAFVRVHRSTIVQTSHIKEVQSQGSSRYRVRLSSGTTVIVSRARAPQLKKWML